MRALVLVSVLAARSTCSYTLGMKTAISIPDDVFEVGEQLARRLKKSRSQLYAEAVAEYVARHDPEALTEAMDAVVADVQPERDRFVSEAVRRVLEHSEW